MNQEIPCERRWNYRATTDSTLSSAVSKLSSDIGSIRTQKPYGSTAVSGDSTSPSRSRNQTKELERASTCSYPLFWDKRVPVVLGSCIALLVEAIEVISRNWHVIVKIRKRDHSNPPNGEYGRVGCAKQSLRTPTI